MTISQYIPKPIVQIYHWKLALLGALFFGFPSKKIKVIGITGTNGKTTTVEILAHLLRENGFKVASLSSLEFRIGDEVLPNTTRMTMPGRFFVNSLLNKAVKIGCQYFVMEVTSQGIEQFRHAFIDFDAAIFTNLSPEHIEAHGGYEKYKAAKGKFFADVKTKHILNLDDDEVGYFYDFPAKEKIGYTLKNRELGGIKIIHAYDVKSEGSASSFAINGEKFKLNLLGDYNVYNALAAISYAQTQNISFEQCAQALAKITKVEGRGEEVISTPFKVIVDYAFTPIALEKLYRSIKPSNGKLIAVLGSAGGGRDKWKRPVLGEIADKFCDMVIVTNEDPFDEDPMEIIEQVASGVKTNQPHKVLDRREAIKLALKSAQPGDVVAITGKGAEQSIVEKGKKVPWSDRWEILNVYDTTNSKLINIQDNKKQTSIQLIREVIDNIGRKIYTVIKSIKQNKNFQKASAVFIVLCVVIYSGVNFMGNFAGVINFLEKINHQDPLPKVLAEIHVTTNEVSSSTIGLTPIISVINVGDTPVTYFGMLLVDEPMSDRIIKFSEMNNIKADMPIKGSGVNIGATIKNQLSVLVPNFVNNAMQQKNLTTDKSFYLFFRDEKKREYIATGKIIINFKEGFKRAYIPDFYAFIQENIYICKWQNIFHRNNIEYIQDQK